MTLTREKIEALREAARKMVQLTSICADWNLAEVEIDGEMVDVRLLEKEAEEALAGFDPDLCDMAEAGQTDRAVLGEDDRQWFRDYLAEGMHTAFRKGSDHPAAGTAWRAIGDLPQAEWSMIVEFVASAMIDGLEHRLSRTAISKAQEDGE